ncbi:MAG TPA: MFS transporter [Burkholderiaceae bacterium]|nr:MFS transporter [Burkholderiaceae bacterium]
MNVPPHILPAIVVAQVAGTSLWFAINAVLPDLQRDWNLPDAALGWLTSAVQAGFVGGTLVFAFTRLPDRWSPRWLFLACAVLGAVANGLAVALPPRLDLLIVLRFLTGASLAGIYPVGMKAAAGWYREGLGAALGLLVGAVILGTALPHGLRAVGVHWPWQQVMLSVSAIALAGGVLMALCVPDGPALRRPGPGAAARWRLLIDDRKLRASVFGYFGHMWELYAMIALVPIVVAQYLDGPLGGQLSAYLSGDVSGRPGAQPGAGFGERAAAAVSLISFVVIAAGGVGSAAGGLAARRIGSAPVAAGALAASGLCCLAAPWMFDAPWWLFGAWMLVWGVCVSSDSPQFSTLTAQNAPAASVGSVLTMVNCVGFSISIVSIQLMAELAQQRPVQSVIPLLAIGPALGLLAMRPLLRRPRAQG